MRRRVVPGTLLLLAVCAGALGGDKPSGAYKLDPGPYPVRTADDLTLRDAKRGKDLHVKVYYPDGEGRFPLIVFSHGAGGSKEAFGPHVRHWAGHGYVVALPTHADSLREGGGGAADGLRGAVRQSLGDPKAWEGRVRDVSFVLDSLDEIERRIPALKGRIDRDRIGVGGHSLGAFTAMLIGGAVLDVPGGPPGQSWADPRPRALLVISGQGTGRQGLTAHSWDRMTRPMLTMTGSRDRGAAGEGPEWRKEPFDHAPPGDKLHVFIEDANHFSFGGDAVGAGRLLGRGGGQKEVFDLARTATLAFWDAYLKGDLQAKAYLTSDALPAYSRGKLRLLRK